LVLDCGVIVEHGFGGCEGGFGFGGDVRHLRLYIGYDVRHLLRLYIG
jgi:hypothetical protein